MVFGTQISEIRDRENRVSLEMQQGLLEREFPHVPYGSFFIPPFQIILGYLLTLPGLIIPLLLPLEGLWGAATGRILAEPSLEKIPLG